MSIWIGSDFHFGHDREFIWGHRGFGCVHEHDTSIQEHIYSTVQTGDTLILLGDIAMTRDKRDIIETLFKTLIWGKGVGVIYVQGNHCNPKHIDYFKEMFGDNITIYPMGEDVKINYYGKEFKLSHFPWKGQVHKDGNVDEREAHLPFPEYDPDEPVLLHGHTHRKDKFQKIDGRIVSIHCGQDAWGRIVNMDEIVQLIESNGEENA